MRLFKNCKNLIFTIIQRSKIQRWQSISCKGKLCLLCGSERFGGGIGQCIDFGGVLVEPKLVPLSKIGAKPTHSSVTASRIAPKLPK